MSTFEVTRDDRTRVGRTISFNSSVPVMCDETIELSYTPREAFKPQQLVIEPCVAPNFEIESIKIDDVEMFQAANETKEVDTNAIPWALIGKPNATETERAVLFDEAKRVAAHRAQAVRGLCFLPDSRVDFHWPLIRRSAMMRVRNISGCMVNFSATFLGYVLRD